MSSLAELMFSAASQNIRDTKSDPSAIVKAFQGGAQLAQQKEKLEQDKKALKQAKDDVTAKGVQAYQKMQEDSMKFKNASDGAAYLKSGSATLRNAYPGLNELIPEDVDKFLHKSLEGRRAGNLLMTKLISGEITMDEFKQRMTLPGIAEVIPEVDAMEAAKWVKGEENTTSRSKDQITAAQVRADTEFGRVGPKTFETKIAADATKFGQTGIASAKAKLDRAKAALAKLEDGSVKTRKVINLIPYANDPSVLATIDPETKAVIDDIRETINLKDSLDSAFSKPEAEQKFARAIDPRLKTELNIDKIKVQIEEAESALENQTRLFSERGYIPKDQIYKRDGATKGTNPPPPNTPPPAATMQLVQGISAHIKAGKTPAQLAPILKQSMPGYTDAQINDLIKQAQGM